MSSILKALQKLEKDKAARQTKGPDISGAILKGETRRASRKHWLLPLGITCVAAASILLTYAVMGGFGNRSTHEQPSTLLPAPHSPITGPAPGALTSEPPSPSVMQASGNRNSQVTPDAIRNVTVRPHAIPPTPPTAPIASPANPVAAPSRQATHVTLPERPSDSNANQPPSPNLNISGIAWQKDSSSRLAVVNGISVSEGGTVEGARIEEIFPDRIRFSQGGRTFEVPLGPDSHP